jgi:tRNA threonylcarbamoyladenosine biosynthesis protein TsaB
MSAISISSVASSIPLVLPPQAKVLALDTSTERLSLALGVLQQPETWLCHEGVAGAQASATLIPLIMDLLTQQGWRLSELDAIAFGCGPGSFTGLRTACAVVQGLAVAGRVGGIPVLPVHTLLAVAEQARWQRWQQGQHMPSRVVAALDARMHELYVAELLWQDDTWCSMTPAWLSAPETLQLADGWPHVATAAPLLAGNAMMAYSDNLPAVWQRTEQEPAWPTAAAMLRLLPSLWEAGQLVSASGAQPLYVRDKVAQTTAEREQAQAVKQAVLQGAA